MAARSARTGQKREPTSMRLSVALREAVAQSASRNNRTIASEIEHRLAGSFEGPAAEQFGLRSVIREEIRAALAERDEFQHPYERALDVSKQHYRY